MSDLCKILLVGQELLGVDRSAEYLRSRLDVSPATLKRYIEELRHLGCRVVSVRNLGGWVYRLENAEQVVERLSTWLRLERQRTLLGPV